MITPALLPELVKPQPLRRGRLALVVRLLSLVVRLLSLALLFPGCATLADRGQTLVPTRYQLRTGPFVVYSNTPIPAESPAVACLHSLEADLSSRLGYRALPGQDPVEIYVLERSQRLCTFSQILLSGAAPAEGFLPGPGRTQGRLHLLERPARGRPPARGGPRASARLLRRPSALARRGTGRIFRDPHRHRRHPGRAPLQDTGGPQERLGSRPAAAGVASRTSTRCPYATTAKPGPGST